MVEFGLAWARLVCAVKIFFGVRVGSVLFVFWVMFLI